jgi:uncharacterized RDD family membrane protein YckC
MTQTPAGWYPDPDPQGPSNRQRYWDGGQWTEHVHDPQPVQPQVQPPAYPGSATPAEPGAAPDAYPQASPQAYPQAYPGGPSSYAPASAGATTPDGVPLSGWWWRVLAAILDAFIQLPLYALAAIPVVVWQWDELSTWFSDLSDAIENNTPDPPDPALVDPSTLPGLLLVVSLIVASTLYSALFLRWKNATPGKLIVGLRVRRRETPGRLPWSTIVTRVGFITGLSLLGQIPIIGLVFLLTTLLDYLWPLWDSKKQALHDKVAGTNVVRPGRESRPPTEAGLPPRW